MHRSYQLEGIIIRRVNIGEADKLITIYSKTQGKVLVAARGIRKITSRKAPHLELFNYVRILLAKAKQFDIVTEAVTLENFPFLSDNLEILAYGYHIIEEINILCPEREEHFGIFNLLHETIKSFDKHKGDVSVLTDKFTRGLLWRLGYLPQNNIIEGESLKKFLETVIERKLKSDSLLTRIRGKV